MNEIVSIVSMITGVNCEQKSPLLVKNKTWFYWRQSVIKLCPLYPYLFEQSLTNNAIEMTGIAIKSFSDTSLSLTTVH